VFMILGLTAGSVTRITKGAGSGRVVEIVSGVAVVLFGLLILGAVRLRWLERVRGFQLPDRLRRRGVAGSFLVGVVFGLGWTPCVGPYLAAALAFAAISAHAFEGAVLLFAYSLGLGVPFIAVALLWASLPELPRRLTRLARPLTIAGGLLTVALGVLVATGAYTHLTSYLAQLSTPH
jgi:cytochrome c-type biogenesis protein